MKDEINYGAIFGIDEGGNEQDFAEPANEQETEQGGNEQEVAEPAEESVEAPDGGEEQASEERPPKEQSSGENARYAAARRKAESERDAAVAAAKKSAAEEAQRAIDEAFRTSGLTNPYTGKAITSKAEFDEYRARYESEKKAQLLKKAGMTEEEFSALVQGSPEMQEAKRAQREAEDAARQAREAEAKRRIDEQIKEISTLDPRVQKLEDIAKMDTYPRFYELVKLGNSLTDAFRLANFDALAAGAEARARRAALNSVQSKQHLTATQSRGAGAETVPEEIRETYLALNPGATEAEIARHYNRYRGK